MLHASYYRTAALTTPTAKANFNYDTAYNDDYGIYVAPTFTAPIAGVWKLTSQICVAIPAAAWEAFQWNDSGGTPQSFSTQAPGVATWPTTMCQFERRVAAGYTLTGVIQTSVAAAMTVGTGYNTLIIDYMGP